MHKLKIAYFSGRMFSDVDISYLMEAQSLADIDYYVPVSKLYYKGAAFNISTPYPKTGIFKATDIYPELQPITQLIDSDRFYIVNSATEHYRDVRNLWLYIKFVWQLRKYDVIHITDFPAYYYCSIYLWRRKIVLTVHDPFPHSCTQANQPLVLKARKWGFRLLRHFIILNQSQKEECIAVNSLKGKNVYDSQLSRYDYLCIYKTPTPTKQDYFLFFGQITSHKGIDILLESMRQIHKQYPFMRLIVAGKGEFSFDISEYKKLEYIEFRNRFIPDEELAELIQGCYAVVCPYKDATQSGVVMSTFAFNKPVIATRVGGLPEQVLHERYGLIVPPCNVDELATAMSFLCEHPEKVQTFSHNIEQDYAEGSKSWKAIARQMLEIYQQVYRSNS